MDLYCIKSESFEYLNSNRTFPKYRIDGVLHNYELEEAYEASRMCVADGRLDLSILCIRTMLPMLRNDPGTNDKELGTFLSVLGSRLTENNEHEEAIKVLGEAMLKIKNIPDSEEKDMLVHENYRALGTSFSMDKNILAIYYFTMYLSFVHLVEEHQFVVVVNERLSLSYFRIGQLEQSIKYAQDAINMDTGINELGLLRIGSALMNLKDFPKAYKYHSDVFKIRKSHPDPVHRQKYLHMSYGAVAFCQMNMKYYSLAMKNFTKAINLFDSNMSDKVYLRLYLTEYSHCCAMLGQFQEAYNVIYITLFKYRVSPHIRNQSIVKIVKFQYTLVLLIFPSFIFQYASVYKKEVYIN
jgi:tetratricopeptide (TPR) repeat protein